MKLKDFSAVQILREMHFSGYRISKTVIFDIFRGSELCFWQFFNCPKSKLRTNKMAIFEAPNWPNLISRKI